jgi:hypothetical protein
MSQSATLTAPGTLGSDGVEIPVYVRETAPRPVDPSAPHHFSFGPQRWIAGLDNCVKASLMFFPGVFLLTQIASSPNLDFQIGIAGAVLSLAGMAYFGLSFRDFFGGIALDRDGIRARLGLTSVAVPWPELDAWSLTESAADQPDLTCLRLWTAESTSPRVVISGGFFAKRSLSTVRLLLETFASGKERATASARTAIVPSL